MINKEVIRAAREKLHLSQYELAQDITTQSTVSRMEREGFAPATEVTDKLLKRLHLQLNDVLIDESPDFKISLDSADEAAQQYDYKKVLEIISSIDPADIVTTEDRLHIEFLKINATMWTSEDFMQGMFDFNKLLDSFNENSSSIYRILAICQLGVAYFSNGKSDSAEYYFNQLPPLLDRVNVKKNLFWVLFVYDNLINFWSKRGNYDKSEKYGKRALNIIEKYRTFSFVDSISCTIGENYGFSEGWDSKKAQQYLLQSWVFANLTHNKVVIQVLKDDFKKNNVFLFLLDDENSKQPK